MQERRIQSENVFAESDRGNLGRGEQFPITLGPFPPSFLSSMNHEIETGADTFDDNIILLLFRGDWMERAREKGRGGGGGREGKREGKNGESVHGTQPAIKK